MIRNNQTKQDDGFTLIELLLSMAFVSVLLVSIAMLIIQIGNIYNRGLTMKEVNQAGRSIASELQSTISQSPQFDIGGNNYVIQKDNSNNVVGMRLCLGRYTYVWNHGKYMDATKFSMSSVPNKYSGGDSTRFRFIKVNDSNAQYCVASTPGNYPDITKSDSKELLGSGENNLAMYSFSLFSADDIKDSQTGQQLYHIGFLLGTDAAALSDDTSSCRPPDDLKSDINYCSINEFNIVARAGNINN